MNSFFSKKRIIVFIIILVSGALFIIGFLLPPLLEKVTGSRGMQMLINIAAWSMFVLILYRTFVTLINL